VSAPIPERRPGAGGSRLRSELRVFLEYFVLCGFAITQPVLDVTGRSPEFFLFNRATRGDILLLVAAVTVLPAAAALAGELLVGLLGRQARRAAHLALVAGLLVVLAVEVAKKLSPVRGAPLVALALVAGLGATWLLVTRPALQLWLRYLTPAPLVFVLVFALASPVAGLVRPSGESPVPAAAGGTSGLRTPPVVMVFFDEFPMESLLDRHGHIDTRMYPNFARLAGDATWYRNATGVNWYTPYAVPAMLTGRYPAKAVAPIYTEYPDNLFTLLARSHDLKVFESVTQLCPPQLCAETASAGKRDTGFGVLAKDTAEVWTRIALPYDTQPDPDAQFVEETGGEAKATQPNKKTGKLKTGFLFDAINVNQPSRFAEFLDSFDATDRPGFHFLHLLLPHTPWRYLPSGLQYDYPSKAWGRAKPSVWGQQRWPVTLSHQRYLLQLAFTDRLIGQLLERLKKVGLYDEALVVVTADHGGSFTPGQHTRIPAKNTAHETAWVPLFLKLPHQKAGEVTDRNWEHVDLVPTVADALGIQVPWRVDGVSALGARARTGSDKTFYVSPGAEGRTLIDGPSNLRAALRGVTDRLLRPQDGPIGLYQVGRDAALVGKSTDAVGVVGPSPLGVTITPPTTNLGEIDPSSGKVPAMVTGKLDGDASVRDPAIAVAVNGTIGGVSEVFRTHDTRSFAAMVPDFLFRQQGNRVELFEVDPSGGSPRLRPIRWRQ
jgi:Sulfatase